MKKTKNVDEYIQMFPKNIQKILKEVRKTIQKTAPKAEEKISYSMPSYKFNGKYIVYFAAWKDHIGLYPTSSGVRAFKKELAPYKVTKGSIHFPLDQPIPHNLIKKIVSFRLKEV